MKRKIGIALALVAFFAGWMAFMFYQSGTKIEITTATITAGFDAGGSTSSASISVMAYDVGNATCNIQVRNQSRSQYRHKWRHGNGSLKLRQTKGKEGKGADVITNFTMELELPNGTVYVHMWNNTKCRGLTHKEFKTVVGPQELGDEGGEFKITITFSITVVPPNWDHPAVEKSISTSRTFTVGGVKG